MSTFGSTFALKMRRRLHKSEQAKRREVTRKKLKMCDTKMTEDIGTVTNSGDIRDRLVRFRHQNRKDHVLS